jgi:hypothetical protein
MAAKPPAAPAAAAGAAAVAEPLPVPPVAPSPPSAAPPPPTLARPRRAPRALLWLGAAAVLAAVLFGIAWSLLSRRPGEAEERVEARRPMASPTAAAPQAVAGRTGSMVLAAPWGELQAVRRADGGELPLPAERSTPLLLEIPPGRYTLTLAHPAAAAPATCDVEVVAGQVATCRVETLQVDVMQYFKDAGWWG